MASRRELLFTFISYYPLKQGLKPEIPDIGDPGAIQFISYYPLKQGLKRGNQQWFPSVSIDLYPTIH